MIQFEVIFFSSLYLLLNLIFFSRREKVRIGQRVLCVWSCGGMKLE